MTIRHPALSEMIDSLEQVFIRQGATGAWAEQASAAFQTLKQAAPASGASPSRIDACGALPRALEIAQNCQDRDIQSAARAFAQIEGDLAWARRANSERAGSAFHDGHANAMLIGPKGLEERSDVWLGVSLMSPDVQYPIHRHPPEELYVVMSEGEWFRDDAGWFSPGIGGTVYNPGNTTHSMRSHHSPLLAFWILWGSDNVSL